MQTFPWVSEVHINRQKFPTVNKKKNLVCCFYSLTYKLNACFSIFALQWIQAENNWTTILTYDPLLCTHFILAVGQVNINTKDSHRQINVSGSHVVTRLWTCVFRNKSQFNLMSALPKYDRDPYATLCLYLLICYRSESTYFSHSTNHCAHFFFSFL